MWNWNHYPFTCKACKESLRGRSCSQAIEDAKNNALLNKIDNADFVCDDAGKYMVELVKKNTHLDVVFVDPPRKGCSEEFLEHLLQASPKEIIYISCDVATQARDAKYLNEHGIQLHIANQ